MQKQLVALAVASVLSSGAFAVEPYLQAQVGQSKFDVDLNDDNDTYFGVGVGFDVT